MPIVDTSVLLFINSLLMLLILYFWGRRRILPHLREKYLRIPVLLFVGSAIGSVIAGLVFLFLTAVTMGAPIFAFSGLIPYSIIQAVSFAFTTTFVGLGAFLIAYFRHSEIHSDVPKV